MPGIVGQMEEYLSYLLDIPIFMGNIEKINSFLNKSGIKSLLEINEIPFPMSAWDITTGEEFYSSLAHLIALYPAIRIWIFKSNNDINGRTTSYIEQTNEKTIFVITLLFFCNNCYCPRKKGFRFRHRLRCLQSYP